MKDFVFIIISFILNIDLIRTIESTLTEINDLFKNNPNEFCNIISDELFYLVLNNNK